MLPNHLSSVCSAALRFGFVAQLSERLGVVEGYEWRANLHANVIVVDGKINAARLPGRGEANDFVILGHLERSKPRSSKAG